MSTAEVAAGLGAATPQPLPCWVDAIRRAQREGDIALHVDRKTRPCGAGRSARADCPRPGRSGPAALSITAETLLNGLLPKP